MSWISILLRLLPCFLFFGFVSCGTQESQKSESQAQRTNKNIHILFFGDSLTAGYGLDNYELAWPHLLEKRFQKDGIPVTITNAGVSGDTTTSGLGRIDWVLEKPTDVFVLELGANDMLRGISPQVTKENLRNIIRISRDKFPKVKVILVGMLATPNLGKKYKKEFDVLYQDLAREENTDFIPFLLEPVAGLPKLNQKDGIHPTEKGHELLADYAMPYLKKAILSL